MSKNEPARYQGFTGRILLTLENGRIVSERTISAGEHLANLNAFIELARLAGFTITRPDSAKG